MKYLIFLICLSLPAYLIRFNIFGVPTTLLEIIIYSTFIIGAVVFLKDKSIDKSINIFKNYKYPLFFLILALLISLVISPQKTIALGQFKGFFIDPLIMLALVIIFIIKEDINWLKYSLIGSASIVSFYSIYQKITGDITVDNRIIGIFGYSPNYVALYLSPIIVICFAQIILTFKIKKYLASLLLVLIIMTNCYALFLSGSRGGQIAVVASIIIYLVLFYWNKIINNLYLKIGLGVFTIATIIALFAFFNPDFNASSGRAVTSNNIRYEIWKTSIELIKFNPILGVGLGNFQNEFKDLTKNRVNYPEYISPQAATPHNIFLMFYLYTGLLGLISFIWILILFFKDCINIFNAESKIILASMIGLLLHGMVDAAYLKNDLSIIFWILIASIIVLKRKP